MVDKKMKRTTEDRKRREALMEKERQLKKTFDEK